jgi:hypothetical protein
MRAPAKGTDLLPIIEPCSHRPADVDHNATLSISIFGNYGKSVLPSYVSTMTGSIAHRCQSSGSHERTEICVTPFTLLFDHFL